MRASEFVVESKAVEPTDLDGGGGSYSSLVSFSISLVAHLALLLGLAVILTAVPQNGSQLTLSLATSTSDDKNEFTAFEVDGSGQESSSPSSMDTAAELETKSLPSSEPTLSPDMLRVSASAQDGASNTLQKLSLAMTASYGGQGKGGGASDASRGEGASFYGIGAGGDRFVFVVDSSRSMIGKRWTHAVKELMRSLESLGPEQRFYVICFDFHARPLFDLNPNEIEYLQPTKQVLAKVRRWFYNLENGFETRPAAALQMAIHLRPDAIYLLSDGEIRDHSKALLYQINRDPIKQEIITPIHTISLFSTDGRQSLQEIAQSNGGTFSSVD